MNDRMPTTEDVRAFYSIGPAGERQFDRWLAEHDRQVKAEAWAEGYGQGARDNERDTEPADNPYLNGDN